MNKANKIVFLPITKNDLKEIMRYISLELHAPLVAEALYKEMIKHIGKLAIFPFSYR